MEAFENSTPFLDSLWLEDFACWESKESHTSLMKDFISRNIDGTQFDRKLCDMQYNDFSKNYTWQEVFDKMKNQELPQIKGFATLLRGVLFNCDVFYPNDDKRRDYAISEEELREYTRKVFLEIQSRYP